jgi:hypothetical protein
MFPQSVWGGHFPHVHTEYVHPVSSQEALRLCHVSSHPTRLGGGASSSVLLDFDTFIAKFKPNLLNVAKLKVATLLIIMTDTFDKAHLQYRDTYTVPVKRWTHHSERLTGTVYICISLLQLIIWPFRIRMPCNASYTGCYLPSMPWDVGQMGSSPREKSSGHHLILW